jgi:hypothetical protein
MESDVSTNKSNGSALPREHGARRRALYGECRLKGGDCHVQEIVPRSRPNANTHEVISHCARSDFAGRKQGSKIVRPTMKPEGGVEVVSNKEAQDMALPRDRFRAIHFAQSH